MVRRVMNEAIAQVDGVCARKENCSVELNFFSSERDLCKTLANAANWDRLLIRRWV